MDAGTAAWLIRHRVIVRFSDCDPLGHVNNARYATYLEQARIALWRKQAGLEFPSATRTVGQRGEHFILARIELDFKSQAHDGDELEVRLGLEGFGRTSATYVYEVVHVATGRLVATARTVQVWFDYEAGRPVPLSETTRGLLSVPVAETSSE